MILTSRKVAVLNDKFYENDNIYYRLTDSKGKDITLYFPTDVCPTANIGDEMYFEYKRSTNKDKKGYYLTNNINEAILSNPSDLIIGLNSLIMSFLVNGGVFATSFLCKHFGMPLPVYLFFSTLILSGIFLPFLFSFAFLFINIKNKKEPKYKAYREEHFTRKERIFDKKLNNLEKLHLINFINQQDEFSSSEKIEIADIISKSKRINISDIHRLDLKLLQQKNKNKKRINLLLSK